MKNSDYYRYVKKIKLLLDDIEITDKDRELLNHYLAYLLYDGIDDKFRFLIFSDVRLIIMKYGIEVTNQDYLEENDTFMVSSNRNKVRKKGKSNSKLRKMR